MKTIKKIAGEILLLFYWKQRKRAFAWQSGMLDFGGGHGQEIHMGINSDLAKDLFQLADGSAADIYNALRYLDDSGFLEFKITSTTAGDLMHMFRVTNGGTDIIEGIEGGLGEREKFSKTFNITLAETINIESLVKLELGSILKTLML